MNNASGQEAQVNGQLEPLSSIGGNDNGKEHAAHEDRRRARQSRERADHIEAFRVTVRGVV
jgi:hypothetical protein